MNPTGSSVSATWDLSTDVGRARYFRYHVERGGFAQLLFNLGGDHLQDIAGMLERSGAEVAARYYERALLACLDDEEAYQSFLAGDFIGENALKSTLQLLSVDYFRVGKPFGREAAAWLIRIGAADGLLIGFRGAFSGSSTTYAHLGEVRDDWATPAASFLELRFAATRSGRAPSGPLQASLRRQGRNTGLVGARFTPDDASSDIVVRVAVGQAPPALDTVGLSPVDAQAVLDGIAAEATGAPFRALGPGRLEVLWAASHPIDSSSSGFKRLAGRLVPLLALPVDAGEEDVYSAWRHQEESVEIARMGAWLTGSLAGHPERGLFRPGATEAELEDLETTLGLELPEPIRGLLRYANGGSFVDDRPRDEDGEPVSAGTSCDLLSTGEMRDALADLVASNDAATQVDRWEGKRPVRPRLRQADGSLVPWPYLPIARTSEGGEFLVLELAGAGRVLDAWHATAPRQWRMVYESAFDFIQDYLQQGGCVRAIGRQAEGPPAS